MTRANVWQWWCESSTTITVAPVETTEEELRDLLNERHYEQHGYDAPTMECFEILIEDVPLDVAEGCAAVIRREHL